MKVPNTNRLLFFEELYQAAREKQESLYEAFRRHDAQYKGSRETDGGIPVSTVRNITYELIESQVSTEIPAPKVTSYHKDAGKEQNARSIESLLLSLRDRLPMERFNDMEERYTYIYGGAVTLVEWDNEALHSGEVGSVKISGISPLDFVGQPGIYEVEDMEYCFLVFDTTAEEVSRRYCLSDEESAALAKDGDEGAATLVVCFYRNEAGRISRFIWAEDKVLSDIEDFYARKRRVCTLCGQSEALCRCFLSEEDSGKASFLFSEDEGGSSENLFRSGGKGPSSKAALSDRSGFPDGVGLAAAAGRAGRLKSVSEEYEILDREITDRNGRVIPRGSRLRSYRPDRFPVVIRRNTSQEKSLFGQSDCAFIRPQQLEINKVLSRVHEKLMMAGIYPYKPDDCQFRYDNSIGGKVLNLRPGESPSLFGMIDTTPDISQDLAYVEATYRDAKRILGISDAYTGEDEEAGKSGEARRIQVAQSEGRLVSKRVMKNAAYADMDRLVFTLYLAYADEPRKLGEKGLFSRYDFLEYDPAEGVYFFDDDFLFSVESETPAKDEREVLWKYNLENYRAGGFGGVGEADALMRYWTAQARCGYPGAKEYAAFFLSGREGFDPASGRESG